LIAFRGPYIGRDNGEIFYMRRFFLLALFAFGVFLHEIQAHIQPYETPIVKYLKKIDLSEKNSNLDLIDCIYIINLDERPEKWQRMKELFDKEGLKVNRVAAINGWKIPKAIQKELIGHYHKQIRPGVIGCFLSHISAIKDAYERGFNTVWILEDDVEFLENVRQLSDLLLQLFKIDPEWDLFYTDIDSKDAKGNYVRSLGSNFRPDQKARPLRYYTQRTLISKDIMKIRQRFGMYSVFYSRKGMKKILDYATHVYLWIGFDIDIHYVPNIQQYSVTRDIVSIHSREISDTNNPPKNATIATPS
jgi:GR25 family glycosyltransferase involved in LPS biosynthesis